MAGSVAELRWKKVAKPGVGAIFDLPKSVRGEDPVVHGGRLWLVGAELQTWVREKKGWRDLGPAGPRLWSDTEVTGAEGAYGLFTNADRLTVATSSGRVFELVDDTWVLVHRPDKEVPLWSSEMAYDPLGKRIVSWLGGKIGSSTGTRYGKGRTWIYEGGAWRLVSEERLSHASAKIRVFFDPGLKRVVRAWAKDVGVLGEAGWNVFHPEQYEADWQAVYADPKTGEVLTTHLFPDSTEVARLELARCVTAGQLPPIDDPPGDVARWFDAEARTLFCEDRRDPRRAWAVDLGPAFDAAKKRGPRTHPTVMDFLVWQTVPVGNACVLDALQDVEYDSWLLRGRSFRDTFPRTAFFRMSERHRKNVRLTDDIWNLSDVKVCSPRLVEFLRKKDVPGLEFLPVTILDHRDKVASREYCIVHCIALQDALDVKRSKPEYSPVLPDEIDEVERLVVDTSRVDPAARVFRLAGFTTPVLVEKGLAQDMVRQKFVGTLFQRLDEWGT